MDSLQAFFDKGVKPDHASVMGMLASDMTDLTIAQCQQIRDIVPIAQWLQDPYFLGPEAGSIYQYWKDVLVEFFEDDHETDGTPKYTELITTGPIGTGKSYVNILALVRMFYNLSCFDYPQSMFNLARSKILVGQYLTVSIRLQETTGYSQLRNIINDSPYFQDHMKPDPKITSYLKFRQGQMSLTPGSSISHFIGADLYAAVLDEANFRRAGASTNVQFAEAVKTYEAVYNRRVSRFMHKGRLHGFCGLASSSDTTSSFVEKRIEEKKNDKNVMIVDAKLWDVRPDRFSRKTFLVHRGNEVMEPEILGTRDACERFLDSMMDTDTNATPSAIHRKYGEHTMPVPVDLLERFESNIITAMRDLGGIPTGGIGGLPIIRERYAQCFKLKRTHPFLTESPTITTNDEVALSRYVDLRKLRPVKGGVYFIHADLGVTEDACGLSMVHREVVRGEGTSGSMYIVDFMLQITAPDKPHRISIRKVREFIIYLKKRGFRIVMVTMDNFGSEETIQELNAANIKSERRSVDRTDDDYMTLVHLINERRMVGYYYPPFDKEIWALEHLRDKKKVDHPPGGCFVGETRIPLLDGTSPMMSELEGRDHIRVYALDKDGRIFPGKAKCFKTKETAVLVDVVLDSGYVARCTPDHRWRLSDGSYKEAASLRPGIDRLTPTNLRWSGANERVSHVTPVQLDKPVPVFDLEVVDFHNFALTGGVFVHNSKDVTDSVAGAVGSAVDYYKEQIGMPLDPEAWRKIMGVRKDQDLEKEALDFVVSDYEEQTGGRVTNKAEIAKPKADKDAQRQHLEALRAAMRGKRERR